MSRNIIPPFFPVAPSEYDQRYFSELVRAFSLFVDQQRNPGEGRNTNIVLTDIPSSDFGLEAGTLFQDNGFVKISLANLAYSGSSSATGLVGTVKVSTT